MVQPSTRVKVHHIIALSFLFILERVDLIKSHTHAYTHIQPTRSCTAPTPPPGQLTHALSFYPRHLSVCVCVCVCSLLSLPLCVSRHFSLLCFDSGSPQPQTPPTRFSVAEKPTHTHPNSCARTTRRSMQAIFPERGLLPLGESHNILRALVLTLAPAASSITRKGYTDYRSKHEKNKRVTGVPGAEDTGCLYICDAKVGGTRKVYFGMPQHQEK